MSEEFVAQDPEEAARQARAAKKKRLEEEGEIAADYLEELLDLADLDGDLEISIEADRASVAIVTEEGSNRRLARLVGDDGARLEALQELTRLAVQTQTGERSRLVLDINGYRARRREEIASIAREAVETVKQTGARFECEPMNPFERKVVHDVVAAAGLHSDSEGLGPVRHVVISLKEEEPEDVDFDETYDADEVFGAEE